MKYMLFLLLLIPISAQSQTKENKVPSFGTEIGINLGYAPDNAYKNKLSWSGGYIRSSIRLLRNTGNIQYGVTIEGGTNSDDYWYLSPAAIMNLTFSNHNAYFYAGAMAGYVCSDDMLGSSLLKEKMKQGYVFGIHGGFAQPIGKQISLTSELAVRSTQLWTKPRNEQAQTYSDIILYFPITIGIRYRF